MHICGQTKHLWKGLAQLPISILDVDHMVDVVAARAALGERVVLAGNHDPVSCILRGTPDEIRDKTRRVREQAGPAFMVGAGCEIPSGTPVDNLKALCEPQAG